MALLNLCTSAFLTHYLLYKPSAQDLFSHHQKEFDACMHLILEKYPSDHKIFAITTLIGLPYPVWLGPFTRRLDDIGRLFVLDYSKQHSSVRKDFYVLASVGGPLYSPEQVHGMLQFFSDTSRSKDYALSGTRYAAASLACLTNISQKNIMHHHQPNPFKCVHLFYPFVVPVLMDTPFSIDPLIVAQGFDYLPQLLVRSSATSELITFLRGSHFEFRLANKQFNFPEQFQFYKSEMDQLIPNVIKAIQNYLEVCDSFST